MMTTMQEKILIAFNNDRRYLVRRSTDQSGTQQNDGLSVTISELCTMELKAQLL